MQTLTESQLKYHDHIPTGTVENDLADTQRELTDYQDELKILMRNPTDNKVRIYMLTGKIARHEDFINRLGQILEYRKTKSHD